MASYLDAPVSLNDTSHFLCPCIPLHRKATSSNAVPVLSPERGLCVGLGHPLGEKDHILDGK